MKRLFYRVILEFLKCLVLAKRFFVALGKYGGRYIARAASFMARLLFFGVYKQYVALRRKLSSQFTNTEERLYLFSGNTIVLSVLIGFLLVTFVLPHLRFWTRGAYGLDTNSPLLTVVGPGEEEEAYGFEESIVETAPLLPEDAQADPYAFALRADQGPIGEDHDFGIDEIVGLNEGGSSMSAPLLLPDAEVTPSRRDIKTYIVQEGDTIASIAAKFGVDQQTILWENNMTARSKIRPGDVLSLLPTSGVSYIVRRGDTIGRIANEYNVPVEKLVEFNRLASAGDIVIGEKLIIPGGVRKAPVAVKRPVVQPIARSGVYAPSQYLNIKTPGASTAANNAGLVWPTSGHRLTQYFHARHHGIDIDGHYDSPIYASDAGVVKISGWRTGYGLSIDIDHGNGMVTRYGHASRLFVTAGERVTKGQVIAMVGTTGRSTGTHLHFEIIVNGIKVNPFRYVR